MNKSLYLQVLIHFKQVALDIGDIVGFDAAAYYMIHQDRKLNQVSLTEAQILQIIQNENGTLTF